MHAPDTWLLALACTSAPPLDTMEGGYKINISKEGRPYIISLLFMASQQINYMHYSTCMSQLLN